MATNLTNFFHICATEAHIKQTRKRPTRKNSKPQNKNKKWFSTDLSVLKKQLACSAKQLRSSPYDRHKLSLFHSLRKEYKRKVKLAKYRYEQKIVARLSDLEKSNPTEFWRTFKQLKDLDNTHKVNPIAPSEWIEHFRNLLNIKPKIDSSLRNHVENILKSDNPKIFNTLCFKITDLEITSAVCALKNGKAAGIDGVPNEMIKASLSFLKPSLLSIFNDILLHGKFPSVWSINTLTPLHKKGSTLLRDNYRGIAVSGCLAKLYLSILHKRLYKFADENNLIPPAQIGYKKGARTTDHILTLKNIIDKYIQQTPRRYLYACFVDFKSAFDSVWRDGLFYKLLQMGIGGNFLTVLQSMYSQVKYCVKIDGMVSKEFSSSVGVKQGCVLSPLLFNLYIADMPRIFDETCDPINVHALSTNCLLFADDLVLLSESAAGLQNCLHKLKNYCQSWGLNINMSKTKVVIFNKGGMKITRYKFYLDQNDIEIVQSYCYLGIVFSSCGTFSRAVKALYDKASKALFAMKKIDTCDNALLTLKLFDTLVLPIMTYSIEVWGPYFFDECKLENLHSLKCMSESMSVEKINVKLCKYVLGVSRKSSNDAVRGELGRYPILLMTMHHWIKFVSRSYTLPVDNILKLSLPTLPEFLDKPIGLTWASKVQSLISTSISKLGSNLSVETLYNPALPSHIQGDFASMYRQSWINSINKNFDVSKQNKLRTYALFKSSFAIENYVLNQRKAKRRQFTKLRISSHHLDVETGRYTRPITPRHMRICKNCNLEEIGDEFHFLLKCPKFQQQRQELFYELSEICEIRNNLDHNTMIKIMHYGHGDIEVASLVCEFVDSCLPNA